MFFVYVLESEINGQYYIGQTNDVLKRLERHNSGYEDHTKKFLPWKLIYKIEVPSRKDSLKLERYLKNLHNPKKVQEWFRKKGISSCKD